jgi:hypothetical protein
LGAVHGSARRPARFVEWCPDTGNLQLMQEQRVMHRRRTARSNGAAGCTHGSLRCRGISYACASEAHLARCEQAACSCTRAWDLVTASLG